MSNHDKLATITEWLLALTTLCAGKLNPSELRVRASTYVPLLAAEYPDYYFSQEMLAGVARRCKWFPSYAELCDAIEAARKPIWQRELAARPRLEAPRAWVALPSAPEEPYESPEEVKAILAHVAEAKRMEIQPPLKVRPSYLPPEQLALLRKAAKR